MRSRLRWILSLVLSGLALNIPFSAASAQEPGNAAGVQDSASAQPGTTRSTKTAQRWIPPRTPWGHPDLQGVYTNIDELNIPIQRPQNRFVGRKREDVTPAELAEFIRESNDTRRRTYEQNTFRNAVSSAYNRYDLKPSRPWLIVDPPDGRIPPLTAEAQKRLAALQARRQTGRQFLRSYEDLNPYERCITHGLRSMMPNADEPSYRIVQAPGLVAITYEMIHEARIIPLDGSNHAGTAIRSYMGDARGRWDGDSLLIETTNFTDMPILFPQGASRELRVIERFTPIAPTTTEWSVTFDDRSAWVRPWTIAMNLTRAADKQEFEYACHEGNLPIVRNLIIAAQLDEKAAGPAGANEK